MPKQHTVRSGECLASIAADYGFLPETIWNHPENKELSEQRDGFVLKAGDVVVIPDTTMRWAKIGSGSLHVFRRKAVPERLRLVFSDGDGLREGVPFCAEVDGMLHQGQTNGKGAIDIPIAPNATSVLLDLGEGRDELYTLLLGSLDPIGEPGDDDAGVRARLVNLGYLVNPDVDDDTYRLAVGCFQLDQQLAITRQADEATREALSEIYGC